MRHLFGALDLATGQIDYRIRTASGPESFVRSYRHCDNEWAAANDIEMVFLPTYSC